MSAHILVIDDEPNIRSMIQLALTHEGAVVEVAEDGEKGLSKFADGRDFDLVILDQKLPGKQGTEIQELLYKRRPDARIILISAHGTMDLALQAIHAGACDFLRKPFKIETLRSAVRSALERTIEHDAPVPAGMVCREFMRSTINGFSFDLDKQSDFEHSSEFWSVFNVTQDATKTAQVKVTLPAYFMELVRAHADTERMPGGPRFWEAMCEEALAAYLWERADFPPKNELRLEELSRPLRTWIDSVMTVSVP